MIEEEIVLHRGSPIHLLRLDTEWEAYDKDGIQLCKNMYCREICLEAAQRLIDARIEHYRAEPGVKEYLAMLEAENKQLREIVSMQSSSLKETTEILEGLLKKIEAENQR
jgi:predicted transcriptional regulator